MKSTWMRVGAVSAVCAVAGAGAGIAGSAAAPSKSKQGTKAAAGKAAAAKPRPARNGMRGRGREAGFGFGHGPAAHEESTVLNKAGTAWITETSDNGLVKSVSGSDIVIAEGTKAVPYKDVTVTIPSGATVMRNGKTATPADLKADDHVHVSSSSDGTVVIAGDDTFGPGGPHGPHGPGDRDGDHHGPPPPGAPGAPGTDPGAP